MAQRSVNKVLLMGHLGKDAETKFTQSGTGVTSFTLATNRRTKDQQSGEWKDETDWHNIVAWRLENLSQYLTKGKLVFVEGRLQTRSYEDKDGKKVYRTEVVADDVVLVGGRAEGGAPGEDAASYAPPPVSMPRAAATAQPPQQRAAAVPPVAGAGRSRAQQPPPEPDYSISDDDVPF